MVNYNPKIWWGLIFQFHKSDTFRMLIPAMVSIAVFCAAVAYVERMLIPEAFVNPRSAMTVHSLLGFVISLLLVFRTNTAYDRWWEGRKLWGSLVNSSRNLAIKMNIWLPTEDTERRKRFSELIGNFAFLLKEHLRDHTIPVLTPIAIHQPNYIAGELMKEVHKLYKSNVITGDQLIILNNELNNMADVCGACERIKKTPIPYSYSLFIKKFIFIYIVTLPFAMVFEFGYWAIALVTIVFYVLASLELIAEEIEQPFGLDANDLPTDDIAETIKSSVKEILKV